METALTFNEVTLTPITHENRVWIKASELARALGYASDETVSRIYRRNADEFSNDMTQIIEIVAEGQNGLLANGRARIFSPRGCHLIAMFARTKVAKAFRRWVLDVLDKVCAPAEKPQAIPQATTPSTADSRKPLRALVHAWAQVTGISHAALWPQVKAHFQLSRIDDLPEEWLPDALAFVQGKIDAAGRHNGNPAPALPEAHNAPLFPVPVEGDKALKMLYNAQSRCRFDFLPGVYSANDRTGAQRARLGEDLYKLQDCLWAALYNVCSAAMRVKDWE